MTVVEDTADLPADVADLIARELLGSRPDGAPWSQRQFTSRLHRRVKQHQDADAAKVEHDRGVQDRGAWARLEEDGTGALTLTGEADRVVAAIGRVDALARRLKQAGDPRTLSQLRADVAADLLLYGLIPDTAGAPPATGGHASTATGASTGTSTGTDTGTGAGPQDGTGGSNDCAGAGNRAGSAGEAAQGQNDGSSGGAAQGQHDDSAGEAAQGQHDGSAGGAEAGAAGWWDEDTLARLAPFRQVGQSPAAHVDVIVPLSTLLALDDGIGVIPGFGPIPGWQARQIALAQGSVWARIVTDPLTGRAVERSINRYHPDKAMREQTEVRDGVCRGPGCTIPATMCQKDHEVEYAADEHGVSVGGSTTEANLVNKHSKHHSRKTKGYWTSQLQADSGRLVWTSLFGRTYATDAMDYHDLTGTSPGQTPRGHVLREDSVQDPAAGVRSVPRPAPRVEAPRDEAPRDEELRNQAAWDQAEDRIRGRCINADDTDEGIERLRHERDRARRSRQDCARCHDTAAPCAYHSALAPGAPLGDDMAPPIRASTPRPRPRPGSGPGSQRRPHQPGIQRDDLDTPPF